MIAPHNLYLATHNLGKIQEFKMLLANTSINILSIADVGVQLPKEGTQDNGATLISNAILKAEAVCNALGAWALADDSGLFIQALPDQLGVDTATFGGPDKLLNTMKDIKEEQRHATFRCVLALARPGQPTVLFEGAVEGVIATTRMGEGGFGYDSVFIPKGENQTYAQKVDSMGMAGKADDHRGRAVATFLAAWPNLANQGL
jgi:XTP/dITP diphosphohydrolase